MADTALTAQNEFLMTPRSESTDAVVAAAASIPVTGGSRTTDAQLIAQVLAGDQTAFEQIFERYKRLAASIAARYFQQPEQIEEIVQITFTKVYFELKTFRGEHYASMASWLGKITTNACFDVLKKRYRKSESLIGDLSSEEEEALYASADSRHGSNAEGSLIKRDLTEKLLQNLHPGDRALLQMLYAEEMSVEQVAAATGWSNSKIKVRAFRARGALRKILRKFI